MIVEYSYTETFENITRILGPHCLDVTDYTGRVLLTDLPDGANIFYRAKFQSLVDGKTESDAVSGRFRTVPSAGYQFFGEVTVSRTAFRLTLRDSDGSNLFTQALQPEGF